MTTPTREQVIERSRIDFECYFLESRKSKGANRAPTFQRYEHDGTYIDDHTQRHWWTWQQAVNAGRDQGLREAAAKVRAILADCEQQDIDDPELEVIAAAIEQLRAQRLN
jgi:hypothetical protein